MIWGFCSWKSFNIYTVYFYACCVSRFHMRIVWNVHLLVYIYCVMCVPGLAHYSRAKSKFKCSCRGTFAKTKGWLGCHSELMLGTNETRCDKCAMHNRNAAAIVHDSWCADGTAKFEMAKLLIIAFCTLSIGSLYLLYFFDLTNLYWRWRRNAV